MARRKTTSRRSRKRSSKKKESPGWVWAVAGLSVGLLVATFIWLYSIENPRGSQTVINTRAKPVIATPKVIAPEIKQPTATAKVAVPSKTVIEQPPVENKFTFYKTLPKETIDSPINHYRGKDNIQPLLQVKKQSSSKNKGQYILQAGSFRVFSKADRQKAKLAILGVESRIEKVRSNDGIWHRIRLGPFNNLEDANQLRTRLLSEKIQTILINAGN
jgi:cell division protein FtsN